MNTPLTTHRNLVTLVQVLRKMEQSRVAPDPDQYRSVVEHIQAELRNHPVDSSLDTLLERVPELAEIYENLQYAHAGLCRSSLDLAVSAEQAAIKAIHAARRGAAAH